MAQKLLLLEVRSTLFLGLVAVLREVEVNTVDIIPPLLLLQEDRHRDIILGAGFSYGKIERRELMWIGWVGWDLIGWDWIGWDWIGWDWIGWDWIGLDGFPIRECPPPPPPLSPSILPCSFGSRRQRYGINKLEVQ
jgi:hypothetical protein